MVPFHRLAIAAAVLAIGFNTARGGSILTLSDFSSDETDPGDLLATLDFSVLGSTLTLTVTNSTIDPAAFDISEIFFNALPHITGLSLTPAAGWNLVSGAQADGFGLFRFALLSDQGNDPGEIAAGDALQFEFEIAGTGPFADTDFTSVLSHVPPGDRPSLAAVKFVNGPRDDSAFGAVIPEPATLALLLTGCGFFARRP